MTGRIDSPKQKFIETALRLFSERGFYGTSLADVSGELGLTKQSILYHFKTKEALYGAALEDVAARFDALVNDVIQQDLSAEKKLKTFLAHLLEHTREAPYDGRLITRELLDNLERVELSRKWYLKNFLAKSTSLLEDLPKWRYRTEAERTAAMYQLIGSISYFSISEPTLSAIWGTEKLDETSGAFLSTLVSRI
ncbi:TetR family transcriptional regulator [Roseibium sp. HPY-6]|uniref:TetR/AcrR family transcriptional regulator n=1 Tax=Roseibium sp. HPY-6 TaxID=3229852 RepID=UPI00338EF2A1